MDRLRTGDVITAKYLNSMAKAIEDLQNYRYNRTGEKRERVVGFKSHAAIPPYAVFTANGAAENFPIFLNTKWATDVDADGPLYTNGPNSVSAYGDGIDGTPIGPYPVLLQCVDDPVSGDRYEPNDDGFLEADDNGRLLCVSNTRLTVSETGITHNPGWFVLFTAVIEGGTTGGAPIDDCYCIEEPDDAPVIFDCPGAIYYEFSPACGITVKLWDDGAGGWESCPEVLVCGPYSSLTGVVKMAATGRAKGEQTITFEDDEGVAATWLGETSWQPLCALPTVLDSHRACGCKFTPRPWLVPKVLLPCLDPCLDSEDEELFPIEIDDENWPLQFILDTWVADFVSGGTYESDFTKSVTCGASDTRLAKLVVVATSTDRGGVVATIVDESDNVLKTYISDTTAVPACGIHMHAQSDDDPCPNEDFECEICLLPGSPALDTACCDPVAAIVHVSMGGMEFVPGSISPCAAGCDWIPDSVTLYDCISTTGNACIYHRDLADYSVTVRISNDNGPGNPSQVKVTFTRGACTFITQTFSAFPGNPYKEDFCNGTLNAVLGPPQLGPCEKDVGSAAVCTVTGQLI